MATCIFTVVAGNYDRVFAPKFAAEGIDHLLFTDAEPGAAGPRGWTTRAIEDRSAFGRLLQRKLKILAEPVAGDHEYSIYVDGNIRIVGDVRPLLEEFRRSGRAAGFFPHPSRSTVADEADACVALKRVTEDRIPAMRRQVALYAAEGFPDEGGLIETGVFFRWHRHPELRPAMDLWFRQIADHCVRDQISLPYVLWKTGLPVHLWEWPYSEQNAYFERYSHRRDVYKDLKTYIEITRDDGVAQSAAYWVQSKVQKALRSLKGRAG